MKRRIAVTLMSAAMCSAGCGYHVAGRSDSLPKTIHVIAVPALENKTTSYRIEQKLTTATVHEFLAKTSYRVVPDPANADAVLRGKVLSLEAVPLLFDTATGARDDHADHAEVRNHVRRTGDGKSSLSHGQFCFPQPIRNFDGCEQSQQHQEFFEEQDPALDRMAQDFAARLVVAVVENY